MTSTVRHTSFVRYTPARRQGVVRTVDTTERTNAALQLTALGYSGPGCHVICRTCSGTILVLTTWLGTRTTRSTREPRASRISQPAVRVRFLSRAFFEAELPLRQGQGRIVEQISALIWALSCHAQSFVRFRNAQCRIPIHVFCIGRRGLQMDPGGCRRLYPTGRCSQFVCSLLNWHASSAPQGAR